MMKLKLFSLTDGDFNVDPTSTWSLAVWAEDEKQALQFVIDFDLYGGGYEPDEFVENCHVNECDNNRLAEFVPVRIGTERRDEVLRLAGWGLEDEDRCRGCELSAMGLEQYHVCGVCQFCAECGHDENCEERNEL